MGIFRIKYITREGHRDEELIVSKTRRMARLRAEKEHDDVISVKRAPIHWGRILTYLLITAGIILILELA